MVKNNPPPCHTIHMATLFNISIYIEVKLPGVSVPALSPNGILYIEHIFYFMHLLFSNITIQRLLAFHLYHKLWKYFGMNLHKLVGGYVLPLVSKGNITLSQQYIQLTASSLCGPSSSLQGLTLVSLHLGGAECEHILLEEGLPC